MFAAELIEWENSDAHEHDTSVCRCRHFDGDCFRSMGGFACACFPLDRSGDPPPLKWSGLRYVFDIQEDCNGKEAIQA